MLSLSRASHAAAGLATATRAAPVAPVPRARCVCARATGDGDPFSSASETAGGAVADARPLFTLDRASHAHDNLTFEDIR